MALMSVYDTFWSEWFWLPENVTWKHLENKEDGIYYPQTRDLYIPFVLAFVVFAIRKCFESFIAKPIGLYFGIKDGKPKVVQPNSALENSYKVKKFPSEETIKALEKQTDLSERQIQRWFRMRRNQERPSQMKRFTEASWRFFFYFNIFVYGVAVLWDKPWFADSIQCWIGYPKHHLSSGVFWYYMIEISFYWSLMFSQFMDVKRKDFWEMFAHHCATIALLTFSWCGNFVRVGTLVLCIHDAVDYWLEAAKMAKYIKAQRLCDVLFAIFGVVWFITRLVLYPTKVMWSTYFECKQIVGVFPSIYFFNGVLVVLLILHAYWFSLIVTVAYTVLSKQGEGQEVTDIRSSDEEEVSEEDSSRNGSGDRKQTNHVNNSVSK
uniref:Ceramide synthase 5-like isoform X2 n=1 Tax=Crassostrea virginica TaxID=6565 RepID=A0A8B8BLE1_CRAVI|nr:ceramide synthase 5-like isoform X2 [Crassostrea virginica]